MKILLTIAETPFLNEWFSVLVRELSRPPYNVEFILYYNSELAYRDKSHLFPSTLKTYRYRVAAADEKAAIEINKAWDLGYISWERQWHHKAFVYNDHAIKEIVRNLEVSIGSVLEAERPDFALYELPSSLLGEVMYQVCVASGFCTYISVTQSRIPDRIDICDRKYCYNMFNPPADGDGDQMLARLNDDFIAKRILPSYMKHKANSSMHEVSVLGHYLARTHRLRFFLSNLHLLFGQADYETQEAYGMLVANLRNHVLRKIRRPIVRRSYEQPVPGEKFALFPLHVTPESSVSGQAMFFSDLLTTIRYIAFCLPLDMMLYVKGHPSAVGTRDRRFYREISALPNVRLISHQASNEALIGECEAVVTLTSTLGLEAALVGKPVFLLGEVFYEDHPMCVKIRSMAELRDQLAVERPKPDPECLLRTNVAFWREYLAHTIPGNILSPEDEEDFSGFCTLLHDLKARAAGPAGGADADLYC